MDDLTASLATSFQVSQDKNTTAAEHPHFSQYKAKHSRSNQEERRKASLSKQKDRRFNFQNHARRLAESDWSTKDEEYDDDDFDEVDNEEETMEVETAKLRPGKYYKDQHMLSEWMVEVPDDFASEWIMTLCPTGKRTLIVASRGKTSSYTKSGYCLKQFPSFLPGGNRSSKSDYSVLDCIWGEDEQTFYIIDIMCWKSHPIYDTETEFRFYWLSAKLSECPELSTVIKGNRYKFVPVANFPCTAESVSQALEQHQNYHVDGLLFYHKRTHYTFGSTPLVTWLKPWMVPEILNMKVPDIYMQDMPQQYEGMGKHIKDWKDKEEHVKQQREQKQKEYEERRRSNDKQETMDVVSERKPNEKRETMDVVTVVSERKSNDKQETMDVVSERKSNDKRETMDVVSSESQNQ